MMKAPCVTAPENNYPPSHPLWSCTPLITNKSLQIPSRHNSCVIWPNGSKFLEENERLQHDAIIPLRRHLSKGIWKIFLFLHNGAWTLHATVLMHALNLTHLSIGRECSKTALGWESRDLWILDSGLAFPCTLIPVVLKGTRLDLNFAFQGHRHYFYVYLLLLLLQVT